MLKLFKDLGRNQSPAGEMADEFNHHCQNKRLVAAEKKGKDTANEQANDSLNTQKTHRIF